MTHQPIYLDHQATTPMDPRVLTAMLPYFRSMYGNPSSINHVFGWEAQEAIEVAQTQCARLIAAKSSEVIFTSGATEAINLALKGTLQNQPHKNHIITCTAEHSAVLDTCAGLERSGCRVTRVSVDECGLVNISEIEAAIGPDTGIICILYANNETGVVQPISEIAALAKQYRILFFTDATQAVGKIPVSVKDDPIDLLCFSAHKMYGPKGVGVLYKRSGVALSPQIEGGGQQGGLRSGTLNVPGIVGMGEACVICLQDMEEESLRLQAWRDELENELMALGKVYRNGSTLRRLPHCTSLQIDAISPQKFILGLSSKMAFSQGAACSSVTSKLSHVLLAMNRSPEAIESSFRFGLGRFNTKEEVQLAIEYLKNAIIIHRMASSEIAATTA